MFLDRSRQQPRTWKCRFSFLVSLSSNVLDEAATVVVVMTVSKLADDSLDLHINTSTQHQRSPTCFALCIHFVPVHHLNKKPTDPCPTCWLPRTEKGEN